MFLLMLKSKKLHESVNCGKSLRMGNVFVFLNWRITRSVSVYPLPYRPGMDAPSRGEPSPRGGGVGVADVCFFLTMRCFNDAMFSNS